MVTRRSFQLSIVRVAMIAGTAQAQSALTDGMDIGLGQWRAIFRERSGQTNSSATVAGASSVGQLSQIANTLTTASAMPRARGAVADMTAVRGAGRRGRRTAGGCAGSAGDDGLGLLAHELGQVRGALAPRHDFLDVAARCDAHATSVSDSAAIALDSQCVVLMLLFVLRPGTRPPVAK